MTPETLSPEAFDALMRRAGLTPSPERRARMLEACAFVDDMIARLWRDLPHGLESAHVFLPDRPSAERST